MSLRKLKVHKDGHADIDGKETQIIVCNNEEINVLFQRLFGDTEL